MNNRRVVLLGSAGTGTAFAAACALRRAWSQSVVVIAMDIHPVHLVTTALLADHFEKVPLSVSPAFSEALLEILRRYEVDTYLPLLPEEIVLAARLHSDGTVPASVSVMVPPLATCEACADKLRLGQLLQKNGLPAPKTASASAPFAAQEFFLKPNGGTGSRGVRKVKAAELSDIVGDHAGEWVVQEICARPEVTVDAFHNSADGFSRVICRERMEIKSGVSTKARLFDDAELGRIAIALAEALKLTGSFCFQVMRNPAGWVVTDVNPRPGAATAMCALTGNDFFAASFARCWGEDARRFFSPLDGEKFVTRQYAEFLMGPKT